MNSLQRASVITILILFSFVFFVLISIGIFSDFFSIYTAIFLTIFFNFFLWLIGPKISDFFYKHFYRCRFLTAEEFKNEQPDLYQFIYDVSNQYRFKFPKIGFIDDLNPTAFTYGSTKNNARIIFTRGILQYLNLDEQKAVFAHEMGHIYHYDFVIMTIAITLIQILYEIYINLSKTKKKSSSGGKKGNPLVIIGLVSYFFYLIGNYLVLYLSRVREFYADSFAAQVTKSPHSLIQALVKIAYGIVQVEDTPQTKKLLQATRSMGIIDVKNAGFISSIVNISQDPNKVAKVMLFDIINPWAKILELSSTHPLTGRRIFFLEKIAAKFGQPKLIDFEQSFKEEIIDQKRLYHNFLLEVFIYFLPYILALLGFIGLYIGGALIGLGLGIIIKVNYRFREDSFKSTTIFNELVNPYTSPLRGEQVILSGQIVGRGAPGFIFSEDMMFQDRTGLAYLDYNSNFPGLGNLFFALKEVKQIIGQEVKVQGWFIRGITHQIILKKIYTNDKEIPSYPKLWLTIAGILLLIVGFLAMFYR